MIDWRRVEELRDEIGAEDFIEVAEMFLQEVDEVMARLRGGPAPGDLAQQLHFLKGSALNLGFQDMAHLCAQGERLAAAGDGDQVDLRHLFATYDQSRTEFDARFGGAAAA